MVTGLTGGPPGEKMRFMDANPTPRELPPVTTAAARQLQKWEQLRDELQALHAELEYLRLMLRLDAGK